MQNRALSASLFVLAGLLFACERLPVRPVVLSEEALSGGESLVFVGDENTWDGDPEFDTLVLREGETLASLSMSSWKARRLWSSGRAPLGYTLKDGHLTIFAVGSEKVPTSFLPNGEPDEEFVPARIWDRDGWATTTRWLFPASDYPLPAVLQSAEYREVCEFVQHEDWRWPYACSEHWK